MTVERNQIGRNFWLQWVLASTVGWGLSWAVVAALESGYDTWLLLAWLFGGAVLEVVRRMVDAE